MSGIILYIEHNPEHLRLVRQAVEEIGLTLFCAFSEEEGLARAELLYPAVILLGLDLPGGDAFQLARRLRQRMDQLLLCVPIIAISGHEMPGRGDHSGEAERAIAAGCDIYLPRPVNIYRLWDLLERFLAVRDFC